MRSRWPRWGWLVLLPVLIGFLVALTSANYRFALIAPGGNDFLARWVGARAWVVEGRNPYDPSVSRTAQLMIYGRPADPARGEDVAHFVYPLPAMIFFAPFAPLPYPLARAIWMTLLEIALPALALLGMRLARWRPGPWTLAAAMLFSVLGYHGFRAVVVGQFAVIEALLMIGALACIQARRDLAAGALLALTVAKPQMAFLLVPFVIFWAARARRAWLLASTAGFTTLLLAASLAVMPEWPLLWLRQVVDYPQYTSLGSPVSIAVEVLGRGPTWLTLALSGLLLIYMVWEWFLAGTGSDRRFQWAAQLTLVITNLIALRTATTNYVVLLPSLCLIFGIAAERLGRRSAPFVIAALSALGLGLWALFLLTVEGNVESAWMYLPLPLLTLAGLWWVRWWARRGTIAAAMEAG